jgi:hypothetical protein
MKPIIAFIFIFIETTVSVNLGATNVQGKIYFVGLFYCMDSRTEGYRF